MLELFVCLVPFALASGGVVLLVLLVRRLVRLSELEREVASLDATCVSMAARIAALEGREKPPAPAPVPTEVEEPPAPAPVPTEAEEPPAPAPVPTEAEEPPGSLWADATMPAAPSAAPAPAPAQNATGAGESRPGQRAPAPKPPLVAAATWEHWVGVRGAAALGALFLAVAGLFLFKYTIDHGLLTPLARVLVGTVTGVGCIAGSERVLRRRFPPLASWVAGAGIAILYTSFWAATSLFHLIPVFAGTLLMVAVTATACILAVGRASFPICVLGLLGGFATPFLLSTGEDRPYSLFGYLLLLDVALLYIAHRKSWPWLALLSVGGTAVYEALWISGPMGAGRIWLGIAILVVFGAAFLVGTPRARTQRGTWALAPIAATTLPFLFGLGFATAPELGRQLLPTAVLLLALGVGAGLGGRWLRAPWLSLVAASASLGLLAVWMLAHGVHAEVGWEVAGIAVVLALVYRLFAAPDDSLETPAGRPRETTLAATMVVVGSMVMTVFAAAAVPQVPPWPWMAGWMLLWGIGLWHAARSGQPRLQPVFAGLVAAGMGAVLIVGMGRAAGPGGTLLLLLSVVPVASALGVAAAMRGPAGRWADHAAAVLPMVLLAHLAVAPSPMAIAPAAYLPVCLALVLVVLWIAHRRRAGAWSVAAAVGTALTLWRWWSLPGGDALWPWALAAEAAGVAALAAAPFVRGSRLRDDRWALGVAAAAPLALFPIMKHAFETGLGTRAIGALPLGLAAAALTVVAMVRSRSGPRDAAARHAATVWSGAVAVALVVLAVPLQLRHEHLTLGWALLAVGLLVLYREIDHPGLKHTALALLGTVTVRLVLNPHVLHYHPRGPIPVLNWVALTYLIPAACLVVGWWLLRDVELRRARPWEQPLYSTGRPLGALLSAFWAIAVIFVWINLAIVDVFGQGPDLVIPVERLPARDLSMSIAWAVYGLVLLALGMRRDTSGLRYVSLALVLVTCIKVFLYDLANLTDLYRVASFAGLAVSLILISVAYQRFVFHRPVRTPRHAQG